MSKERLANVITIALILGALGFFVARKTGPRSQPQPKSTPQDAIYAMLDAARAGDANAYLSRYTGQMQATLRQVAFEKGLARFGEYLRSSSAEIKGIAVSEPTAFSDREVQIRVEYVYQDRNEAQTAYLEKVSNVWKITRVEGTERVKTLVPYGTPVQ